MSKNKADKNGAETIQAMQKQQAIHQQNWFRGRHRVVMLTNKEPLIIFTAAGDTAAWTDLDCTLQSDGITPTSITEGTIAVILQAIVQDSGSAATTTYLEVRPNGSTDDPGHILARGGHINNMASYAQGIVAVDTVFKVEYKKDASGAGTLTGSINLIGYIEKIK